MKVYLAGDISPDRWRVKLMDECKDCKITWLSPIDNISYSYQSMIPAHKKNTVFHIADLVKLREADVVFAYLREKSVDLEQGTIYSGTSWELGCAHILGKPTIIVCDMKPSLACKYELVRRMAWAWHTELNSGIDNLRELALEMMWVPQEDGK
jgi:nucleoside 2-deoxyribosyltransferase